jgi:hypothetical protein
VSYDPNPDLKLLWRIFRPRDLFINKAVIAGANAEREIPFYFMERGIDLTSSAIKAHASEHAIKYGISFREVKIIAVPIDEVLNDFYSLFGKSPGILLIDIEGLDLDIVSKICLDEKSERLPDWIFMESLVKSQEEIIGLCNMKYEFIDFVGPNILLRRIA